MTAFPPRLLRVLTAAGLLLDAAALFLIPDLVLGGGPAVLSDFTLYGRVWVTALRALIHLALSWVWIWTHGSPFQICLTLLLIFCAVWAAVLLLRLRRRFPPIPSLSKEC